MSQFQRQLFLIVLLAGFAGFAGVWFGARSLPVEPSREAPPLRLAVDELARRGLVGLSDAQKNKINEIERRFARQRTSQRARIAIADSELADALAVEMSLGPKVDAAIEHLKTTVGELQHQTVAYVLDLRAVLTEEQQMVFDEKVVAALMAAPE